MAARVASEMLYASKCVVALEAPEGPLKMVRIESASAGVHVSIHHEPVRMCLFFRGAPIELAHPYIPRSITNYDSRVSF